MINALNKFHWDHNSLSLYIYKKVLGHKVVPDKRAQEKPIFLVQGLPELNEMQIKAV